MTMYLSTISTIYEDKSDAHLSLQAPYGTSVDLTVYDKDTESTISLEIDDVESLIECLTEVIIKMKGYDKAKDKEKWIRENS